MIWFGNLKKYKMNSDQSKAIFDKLDEISKDITDIKIQTTKTNGRVNAIEPRVTDLEIKQTTIASTMEELRGKFKYYLGVAVGSIGIILWLIELLPKLL